MFHKITIEPTNINLIDQINCNTKGQVVFDKSKAKIELKTLLKVGKQKETNKKKRVSKNSASKKRKTSNEDEISDDKPVY